MLGIGVGHRGEGKGKSKSMKKDPVTNQDAEAISNHYHRKGHRSRRCEAPQGGKDRMGANTDTWLGCPSPCAEGTDHETNEASGLTAGLSHQYHHA